LPLFLNLAEVCHVFAQGISKARKINNFPLLNLIFLAQLATLSGHMSSYPIPKYNLLETMTDSKAQKPLEPN